MACRASAPESTVQDLVHTKITRGRFLRNMLNGGCARSMCLFGQLFYFEVHVDRINLASLAFLSSRSWLEATCETPALSVFLPRAMEGFRW